MILLDQHAGALRRAVGAITGAVAAEYSPKPAENISAMAPALITGTASIQLGWVCKSPASIGFTSSI